MADEKLMRYTVKAHYLDASALAKLVAEDADEEPGRAALRAYYYGHSSKYATSYCVTEAFSAFKLKFLRKKITEEQYILFLNCDRFTRKIPCACRRLAVNSDHSRSRIGESRAR